MWQSRNRGRPNKFNAKRTANGFPSKLEAAVFEILQQRAQAGEIRNIKRQQTVVLQDGDKHERITWKVDFSFERIDGDQWTLCYAEAKGIETAEYRLKLKLWRKLRPAPLEIWKGSYARPIMVEKINCHER